MTAVDWARVERATVDLEQRYWYTYSGPVTNMRQRLVMIPPDEHGQQRLLSFGLEIRGAELGFQSAWTTDAFGNRVCHVEAPRVERMIEFAAHYTVERWSGVGSGPTSGWDMYREATALTAPDAPRLR